MTPSPADPSDPTQPAPAPKEEPPVAENPPVEEPTTPRKERLEPTRYGDWELNGKCVDF